MSDMDGLRIFIAGMLLGILVGITIGAWLWKKD